MTTLRHFAAAALLFSALLMFACNKNKVPEGIIKEKTMIFRREPTLEIFMKGEFAGYNRLTGKYFHNKMYFKDEIEEVLTLRTDWQQHVFASELKRYINRTLEDKTKKKNR